MTPKEANENFLKLAMAHCQAVQGGEFGEPTLDDLTVVGRIHALIEKGLK